MDGSTLLNKKHNVVNGLSACATMGALAKSVSYDLMRGRRTVNLGSPARTDFSSLAARFRRSAKDNVVLLSGGVLVDSVGNPITSGVTAK